MLSDMATDAVNHWIHAYLLFAYSRCIHRCLLVNDDLNDDGMEIVVGLQLVQTVLRDVIHAVNQRQLGLMGSLYFQACDDLSKTGHPLTYR